MTTLLFGSRDQCGRLSPERRSGMKCSGASETGHGASGSASQTRSAHDGLARTNGSTINRLAGNGRSAPGRHSRTRGLRNLAGSRTSLLQARHHVGARWNHRTRGRLTCEIRPGLRAQRSSWNRRRRGRRWTGSSRSSVGSGDRSSRQSDRCGRHWRRSRWSSCRQGLPRAGKNLSRPRRRRSRPRRYGSGSQWRMHRSTSASSQRRPQRSRSHSGNFLHHGSGNFILGGPGGRRFSGRWSGNVGHRSRALGSSSSGGSFLFFFQLGDGDRGRARLQTGRGWFATLDTLPNEFCNGFIDGAGVGLFLGDAELGKHLEDDV